MIKKIKKKSDLEIKSGWMKKIGMSHRGGGNGRYLQQLLCLLVHSLLLGEHRENAD